VDYFLLKCGRLFLRTMRLYRAGRRPKAPSMRGTTCGAVLLQSRDACAGVPANSAHFFEHRIVTGGPRLGGPPCSTRDQQSGESLRTKDRRIPEACPLTADVLALCWRGNMAASLWRLHGHIWDLRQRCRHSTEPISSFEESFPALLRPLPSSPRVPHNLRRGDAGRHKPSECDPAKALQTASCSNVGGTRQARDVSIGFECGRIRLKRFCPHISLHTGEHRLR